MAGNENSGRGPGDAENRRELGPGHCFACGGDVLLKLNKDEKAYYYCKCGSRHFFNRDKSNDLIAKHDGNGQDDKEQKDDGFDNIGQRGSDDVGSGKRGWFERFWDG